MNTGNWRVGAHLGAAVLSFLLGAPAMAAAFLNGGFLYEDSGDTGANVGEPLEWDSLNTPNNDMFFNGVTATPVQLADGLNSFAITENFGSGTNTGLGLFFTNNNTLVSTFGLSPHLAVYVTSAGGFAYPAAGTQVATIGQFSGNAPYNGATSFTVDDRIITVTAWNGTSLQLNVGSIPEPSSALLLATAAFGATSWRRGRKV